MTSNERRSVISIALLYVTRMLGLFMVFPVFMLYGQELEGATSFLLGLAIGAYGLSQAIFQIPFGALSDRFGRKRLIHAGLLLFCLGSVVAALSTSIYGVILGRFLQGAGAIAGVLMALLSDQTSEDSRTKAMAVIGMSIGVSFSIALIAGPFVAQWSGLHGIFWLTAVMALLGMVWLHFLVPTSVQHTAHRDGLVFRDQLSEVLKDHDLLRLNFGIFALHLCLTALFVAVPRVLANQAGLPKDDHWFVYLTVMVLSFFAMVPFIILAEKKRKMKPVFLGAILLLMTALLSLLWTQTNLWFCWFSLFAFFMAFNLLEASLPSLVSKQCPAGGKGTAMGVYSTAQFLGAFVGGAVGGWVLNRFDESGIFVLCAAMCAAWWLVALSMRKPNPETSMTLPLSNLVDRRHAEQISAALSAVRGVEEAVVIFEDRVAYLKVIKDQLDVEGLKVFQQGAGSASV